MTLHFLGPVAAHRIDPLGAALVQTGPSDAFTLEFGSPQLWPRGTAVTCPWSTPAALLRLWASLGEALRTAGLPIEQCPFRPHVTLARRAYRARLPPEGPAVQWDVRDGFALVQSLPGGQGYRVLQRFG